MRRSTVSSDIGGALSCSWESSEMKSGGRSFTAWIIPQRLPRLAACGLRLATCGKSERFEEIDLDEEGVAVGRCAARDRAELAAEVQPAGPRSEVGRAL